MKLEGKVALITGSSKGIGRAIALEYVNEGCAVVINSRSQQRADKVANEILENGGRVKALAADITHKSSILSLVTKTLDAFGKIDILVNNAGISMTTPAIELTEEDWDKAMGTDLKAYFLCSQAVANSMIKNGGGKIINITSMFGSTVVPGRLAYTVSKAAANMLSMALAMEWAEHGITVNALAPGYVMTEMIQDLIQRGVLEEEVVKSRTPLKRLARLEDVSRAALFLASNDSDYITGEVLRVDGGWVPYGGW